MLTISRDGKVKSQDNVNTCSDVQKHKIHCFRLLSLVTASVNTVPSGIAAFSNHKTKYNELTIFSANQIAIMLMHASNIHQQNLKILHSCRI